MRSPTSGGGAAPDIHGYPQMDTARGGTRYYMAGSFGSWGFTTTFTYVANIINAVPMVFARDTTITGVHIHVSGGAGPNVRMGIYDAINDASNLYPNTLIIDAGAIATAGGGLKSLVISQKLTGGKLYWLASVSDGAPVIYCPAYFWMWPLLGWSSTMTGRGGTAWYANQAYGAMPATFPTAGSGIYSGVANVPGLAYSMS